MAEPAYVQLLDPQGSRVEHPEFALELSDEQYRGLYRDLVVTRRFDHEASMLQRQGELGLWVPCLGQEAAQVGSGRALQSGDYVFPSYREHGVALVRGLDPVDLLRMWRGASNGGWDPAEHNFHLYTIVIGSQVLHAVGYGMGLRLERATTAVVAYFGDGAMSQGDVAEAFNFAGVYGAPVVFFCQNNQWAISKPVDGQSRGPLHERAAGYGFPGVRVDGNDVLACLAVTRWALDRARAGGGPALIEAFTYRMGPHTTSDDPTRYRADADVDEWRLRDPIERYRSFLQKESLAGGDFFDEVEHTADELAARVRARCLEMPDPAPLSMFDNVYPEGSADLLRQRARHEAYRAGFAYRGDGLA